MITLNLYLADIGGAVSIEDGDISFGRSYIVRFGSPMLVSEYRALRAGIAFWIGESADPFEDDNASLEVDYSAYERGQGVKCRFEMVDGQPRAVIARTCAGASPFFVAASGDRLSASWRFEDAVALFRQPRPNLEACRHYLEHHAGLVREMVIEGVAMLWPGEVAIFDRGGIRFHCSPPRAVAVPTPIHEASRATEHFVHLVGEELRPLLERARTPVVEFSGGLDSSCVAVAARTIRQDLFSYGLLHEGVVGAQQKMRREELIQSIGLRDFAAPGYLTTPLLGLADEELAFTPYDNNHRPACARALDSHPARPIDLVISGVGGDELTLEKTYTRLEWELPGDICPSALVAAVCHADAFMRRGIWLCNPLLARPVVDLCRALPRELRQQRMLNLLVLARAGLSDGFLFPRYAEHFGAAMQREAALFDFDAALQESIVSDYGISDISPLLSEARRASHGGFNFDLIGRLYSLMKLECVLKHYVG